MATWSSCIPFIFLSFAIFIINANSRSIDRASSISNSSPAKAAASHGSPAVLGPIHTNGRIYSHVCDPRRFDDLSLKISDFRYCDKSLSYEARVTSLVRSLTLSEKARQLGDLAEGVDRIGLPPYSWWSEALHGVSSFGRGATHFSDIVPGATSFPTVLLSAASFNESLWKLIGQVTSTEARAMRNLGHAGLTFWSPNINVARDPRWGRILETPGEDPFVAGRYAVNFVRGLQDVEGNETAANPDERPLKVASCCKHHAAYDLDNWMGIDRLHFDARVTEQDMVETFLPPFETCVKEGDVSSVMCSYNKVNGVPSCADPKLLSQTIRGEWKLHGYIVSDCDSIEVMNLNHKWLGDTPEASVGKAFRAGLDLDCGVYYTNYTESAVAQGKVREEDIDKALKNNYIVLMRLGFFDGMPVYESLGKKHICTEDHLELAADAARQGIVLLKNQKNLLPLSKNKNLALVGPHANATTVMIGNYAGIPCRYVSPLDAFSGEAKVEYDLKCDIWCNSTEARSKAKQVASQADATIILAGLSLDIEAESLDRTNLLLPEGQVEFINEVAEASKGPVVLVILSAGGVDISFAINHPKIGAIVWAGYPGGEGGRAIADVVFGRYNPGGRLPITWYKGDYTDKLPMTSMKLRPIPELGFPGRTYKFFNGSTVYPFGHGLSYTKFNYKLGAHTDTVHMKLEPTQKCLPLSSNQSLGCTVDEGKTPCEAVNVADGPCDQEVQFELEVSNNGEKGGEHVVLVYSRAPASVEGAPLKQVVAFQRVFVPAGKVKVVKFAINACKALGIVEKTAYKVVPCGEHTIFVGDGDESISFRVKISFSY